MGLSATGEVEAGVRSRTGGGGDGGGSGQRLSGQDMWLPVAPAQLIHLSLIWPLCMPTVCWALGYVLGHKRQGHACPHRDVSLTPGHCPAHSRHLPKTG